MRGGVCGSAKALRFHDSFALTVLLVIVERRFLKSESRYGRCPELLHSLCFWYWLHSGGYARLRRNVQSPLDKDETEDRK